MTLLNSLAQSMKWSDLCFSVVPKVTLSTHKSKASHLILI